MMAYAIAYNINNPSFKLIPGAEFGVRHGNKKIFSKYFISSSAREISRYDKNI